MSPACAHCAAPLPDPPRQWACREDGLAPVCCEGCRRAAEWAAAPQAWRAARRERLQRYDRPAVLDGLCPPDPEAPQRRILRLHLPALVCGACALSVERALAALPGVDRVVVEPLGRRVHLRFDPSRLALGRLIEALEDIGQPAVPERPGVSPQVLENRAALKRLLVAGFGAMQTMMYAAALYAGAELTPAMDRFLAWVSLLVATPVLFYGGAPFFAGAWRALRARRLGMDQPIALALITAYLAGLIAAWRGGGTVYFDSLTMFVFFLSLGRYAEMRARHRAAGHAAAFAERLPPVAARLTADGGEDIVPCEALSPGDRVRLRPGDAVPCDGTVIAGRSEVDEALLTGESAPLPRGPGDALVGGSLNVGGELVMRVDRPAAASTLAHLQRLLERAQAHKPALAQWADRWAGHFVAGVLFAAAASALAWLAVDPARALAAFVAVLVVSCPCALSLATPAALTVAIGRLARAGVLVTRADAVEHLARARHVLLDKTGTLTVGRPVLQNVELHAPLARTTALAWAAALERPCAHPLALALRPYDRGIPVEDWRLAPGEGVEGGIEGRRLRLGRRSFALPERADLPDGVWLADANGPLARLVFEDALRPEAASVCAGLRARGLTLELLSGDAPAPVRAVAEALGLPAAARLTPQAKLERLRAVPARPVLAIGDGINDAPLLAAADVSIALSHGPALSHAAADVLIETARLASLPWAIDVCRRTLAVIRQNVFWALAYNAAALPWAASGRLPAWAAALGMSLSSLLVVCNALRLGRRCGTGPGTHAAAAITLDMGALR